MTDNRLCFVSIRTKNLDASAHFYKEILGIHIHPGEEYPHYECSWNDPYLHFAIFPSDAKQPLLAFAVDNLEHTHKRVVAAGAEVVSAPMQETWGRSAEYRDPDGNIVSLVELSR